MHFHLITTNYGIITAQAFWLNGMLFLKFGKIFLELMTTGTVLQNETGNIGQGTVKVVVLMVSIN